MKNLILIIIFAVLNLHSFANLQKLEKVQNRAFMKGEKLSFKLFYSSIMTGNVTAGEMTSEISTKNYIVRGDTTLNIKVVGKTKGAFSWFFKVNDVYQTYIDVNYMIPRYFIKRISEGDYVDSRDVKFYHEKERVDYRNNKNNTSGSQKIGKNVQDLISAIYYARNFNTDTFKLNDNISISFFMDDAIYQTKLKYIGKQTIKTSIGRVECLKFRPSVLTGGVFKDEDKLIVYISNDANHLPILAESEVMIGSVRIELVEYSNLKNKFSSLKINER